MKRFYVVSLVAVSALFAACGNPSTIVVVQSPTAPAPTATATPAANPSLVTACFGTSVTPAQVAVTGDIYITQAGFNSLAYPAIMLPDGTDATKPFKLTDPGGSSDFPNSPATNPSISDEQGGGLTFQVCNTSTTQTHVVQSVQLKITAMTAYTGSLNEWNLCDGVMDSHHNLTGGGCGGAKAFCECFHVSFLTPVMAGGTYPANQTGADLAAPGDNLGTLPLSLAPGKTLSMDVGIDPPPTGYYQFQMGVAVDAASTMYGPATQQTLFSPVTHQWGALNCQQPAMLAQITPTTPESYYICA